VPGAELLLKGRNGEVVAGVVSRVRAEPDLPSAAIEVDERNVRERPLAGNRALETRKPETEALLVVRSLDPDRMLRAHPEQGAAGRGLRVTDIDGTLADVGVELDLDQRRV